MSENLEVRKIPKKTFIWLLILVGAGLISMFVIKNGKAAKATKILHQLGYTNVKNVSVFAKTEFLNENSNVKGYQYALKFTDVAKNKKCRGFIVKDFKGKAAQDLDCK